MTNISKGLIESFLYKEFYEAYDHYITDTEFNKKYPELTNKKTNDYLRSDCKEIITAFSEFCNITYEEAEDKLVSFYNRRKIRQQEKEKQNNEAI